MTSHVYTPYHSGEAYVALRRDLDWESLTPHARGTALKSVDGEQPPYDNKVTRTRIPEDNSNASSRFYSWLQCVACEATPATAAVDNGLTCDRSFTGGRLVCYRHRTFIMIGGSYATAEFKQRSVHTSHWLRERGCEEEFEGDAEGGRRKASSSGPRAASALPDESCVYEATELRPLVRPTRILLGPNAASFPGAAALRRLRTMEPAASSCTLPPLEGCAVATYGRCILVHGGMSPSAGATDELRAFLVQYDANRPGEYELYDRIVVRQMHGSDGSIEPKSRTVREARRTPAAAWWLPTATISAAAVAMAAAGPPTAEAAAAAAGFSASDSSQPCLPPSARHGHHMAVDVTTSRLWMFGGKEARRRDASTSPVQATMLPVGHTPGKGEDAPADLWPSCYWAHLPDAGGRDGSAGAAASGDQPTIPPAANRMPGAVRLSGSASGGADKGGASGSPGDDEAFPGGTAAVKEVKWHCLALRLSQSGGGEGGSKGRGALVGPRFPDPTRVAAISVCNGGLYVLSSGLGRYGGGGNGRDIKVANSNPVDNMYHWWLHRINVLTGVCELLDSPAGTHAAAAAAAAFSTFSTGAADATLSSPPLYHDAAVAMADDVLPYIYVYGSTHRGGGGAALHGGSFVPSLHRVRLGDGSGGGGRDNVAATAASGRWELVELVGTARPHVAQGALGTASGGSVTLVSGVRDARRGVEPRVQVVAPVSVKRSSGSRRNADGATRVPRGSDTERKEPVMAAALARCRRVIADRLRRVAPGEVCFANPNAIRRGKSDVPGGNCGGKSVVGASRPCVALAAALSMYSHSALFDDFFEELNDGDSSDFLPATSNSKRRADDSRGYGGDGGGMTMPGHDPLAVAMAVAWVMGRTHVRSHWEPRFLLQVFRIAHCWELVALQREIATLVARVAPLLPLQQVPAVLGLCRELRRLGAVRTTSSGAGRGGDEATKVEAGLRARLQRAASSGEVHCGNVEEVMEAVLIAKEAAEAAGGEHSDVAHLTAVQQGCIQVAEAMLVGAGCSSSSLNIRSSKGDGVLEHACAVTFFACRFGILPLLFKVMRWWRRRLLSTSARDGATLDQLLELLSKLQRQCMETDTDKEARGSSRLLEQAAADAGGNISRPTLFKRPHYIGMETGDGGGNSPNVITRSGGGCSSTGPGCNVAAKGAMVSSSFSSKVDSNATSPWRMSATVRSGCSPQEEEVVEASEVPLVEQMRGYLWGELLRSLRPHTAVGILRALERCSQPPEAALCQVWLFVRQQAYGMLAALPPAQRLQLPTSFRTPGHPDYDALTKSVLKQGSINKQAHQKCCSKGISGAVIADRDGRSEDGSGQQNGTSTAAEDLMCESVTLMLRRAQRLSTACDAWQKAQEELLAGRTGVEPKHPQAGC